jgi:hypothetical protein
MRVEEFLSWQLYYLSLFDLHKRPAAEISDTLGLVQSQPLESEGGEFRVILNGANANQTLAARFIEGEMGAGVQHIAFQTSGIFSAAKQASSNGLPLLPTCAHDFILRKSGPRACRRLISFMTATLQEIITSFIRAHSRSDSSSRSSNATAMPDTASTTRASGWQLRPAIDLPATIDGLYSPILK